MPSSSLDVLQRTLDLLVLKALSLAARTAAGSGSASKQLPRDALRIGQGALHPALFRLERMGLVASDSRATENNRDGGTTASPPRGSVR